jgi:hypothetical protein
MFCCLLALMTIAPIGLAVTAPRGRPACCTGLSRLWLIAALSVLTAGCALFAFALWFPGQPQSLFRHVCSVLPLR